MALPTAGGNVDGGRLQGEFAGFINEDIPEDRKVDARLMNTVFTSLYQGAGVLERNQDGLEVSASTPPAMTVQVAGGYALLGLENLLTPYLRIAPIGIGIQPSTNQARIDLIGVYMNLNLAQRFITISTIEGTPAAAPVAPTVGDYSEQDSVEYFLTLAQVRVRANTTSILTTDITDARTTTDTQTDVGDNDVRTRNIQDGAVTTPKLAGSAVTIAKMANNSVDTPELVDEAVTTPKIDDEAVTTAKIDDEAVTTAKIDDGAVTNVKLGLPIQFYKASISNQTVSGSSVPNSALDRIDDIVTGIELSSHISESFGSSRDSRRGIFCWWSGQYTGVRTDSGTEEYGVVTGSNNEATPSAMIIHCVKSTSLDNYGWHAEANVATALFTGSSGGFPVNAYLQVSMSFRLKQESPDGNIYTLQRRVRRTQSQSGSSGTRTGRVSGSHVLAILIND